MGIAAFIFTIVGILTIIGFMVRFQRIPLNKILEAVERNNEHLEKLNKTLTRNDRINEKIKLIDESIQRINEQLSNSDIKK